VEPIRRIEEAIRNKLRVTASPVLHDRVLARVRREQESPEASMSPTKRTIMRRPLVRLAGAAAALILIGVVLHLLTGSFEGASTAYGVTDLPERIRNAKTMHWKGWFYLPPKGKDGAGQLKQRFDYWFDSENGRYARQSPVKARVEVRENAHQMLLQMFGNIDLVGRSVKVGREQIEGTEFDVWQCEYDSGLGAVSRVRTWLDPGTGDIGRVVLWQKRDKSDPNWLVVFDLHTIALDVKPPADLFCANASTGLK